MARQPEDKAAPDAVGIKPRGRPPTGHAKPQAQRKREQRRRDFQRIWTDRDLAGASVEGLLTAIRHCIADGHVTLQEELLREAMRRTQAVRDSHKNIGPGLAGKPGGPSGSRS